MMPKAMTSLVVRPLEFLPSLGFINVGANNYSPLHYWRRSWGDYARAYLEKLRSSRGGSMWLPRMVYDTSDT